MIYESVEGHAALVGQAKDDAQNPALVATFRAQQLLAERLLGLTVPAVTDTDDLDTISLALALQIVHQYVLGPEAFVFTTLASQPQNENRTYRNDVQLVSPQALLLVEGVLYPDGVDLADRFRTVTSVRGPLE